MRINLLVTISILIFLGVISNGILYSQGKCCCFKDSLRQLDFPGLDFEFPPPPPSMWFTNYPTGPMGPWTVTSGTVDHVALDYPICVCCGNPNGCSNFVDLFGSPPGNGGGEGTISYQLTGLIPGNLYIIEFYYATFDKPGNYSANVKVANGAWLNKNWTASNPGNVVWLKASYQFTAQSSSTNISFTDTGNVIYLNSQNGMLIDDVKIFEKCLVADKEKPIVTNPPKDVIVECDSQIPSVPNLTIIDNCDPSPSVTYQENMIIIDPCTKKLIRTWEIIDECGNSTVEDQIIDVIDNSPPRFLNPPEDKRINCDKDVRGEFNDWIKKKGNANVTDPCTFTWMVNYNYLPQNYCDSVHVEFIATDLCGNESIRFANFIVIDTTAPKFIDKAQSKNYICIPNTRDSLRNWLKYYGFSKTSSDCGIVILSSNFNGDSTKNPLSVTFYAEDNCGNVDSCIASFYYRNNSDTFRVINYSCSFSGNKSDTIIYTANGCDSVVILDNIKRLADSTYIQTNTCDSLYIKFDTLKLLNIYGCDSLIFQEFVYHPMSTTFIQISDCSITKFESDTLWFQGIYCDSIIITEYIPLPSDSNKIVINTCDKSKEDTTVQVLLNHFGCDSIVTIYTVYTMEKITYFTSQECDLLLNYIDTFKIATGLCDSLVIISHIGLPKDTLKLVSSTCDKSKAGLFTNKYLNRFGCDSLVINEIILLPSDSILLNKETCILSNAGVSKQKLLNIYGCDSIIQIVTRYISPDTTLIFQKSCDISNSGIKTITLKGQYCDSVVIVTTEFIPSDTTIINQSTCNLADAGVKTLLLKGLECDSIVNINTVYLPSDTTLLTRYSCDPLETGLIKQLNTNRHGCDSLVLITTLYQPLNLQINLDSISCYNQNDGIIKILNSSDFSQPYDIYINNSKITNQNQIDNLSPGSYVIYVRDRKGCLTDSISITLNNPPALIIELGNDLDVLKGTKIHLDLQSNRKLQLVFWQPSNLINCNNCNSVDFIVDNNTWVYAQAIDERNCIQFDSIFIRARSSNKFFVPNSFSPNGDNINDYFYIIGSDDAVVEALLIFDRWGEKIFEANNFPVNIPTKGWNGTFKGQKINPGVFVYIAYIKDSNNQVTELKGNLTLIR